MTDVISPARLEPTCLAEEWVRDGRGFFAVRRCENHSKGRHGFGSWSYYAKPPYQIRAESAEALVASLTQERDEAERRVGELVQSVQARTSERDQAREATKVQETFYEAELARLRALDDVHALLEDVERLRVERNNDAHR